MFCRYSKIKTYKRSDTKEVSFVERTGVRSWGRDRGTQEDLKTGTHIGSERVG